MLCSRRRRAHPISPAPEARQIVPTVKPWVSASPSKPAPDGAKESSARAFLPPLPGLDMLFERFTHGFTVGYCLSPLRGWIFTTPDAERVSAGIYRR